MKWSYLNVCAGGIRLFDGVIMEAHVAAANRADGRSNVWHRERVATSDIINDSSVLIRVGEHRGGKAGNVLAGDD